LSQNQVAFGVKNSSFGQNELFFGQNQVAFGIKDFDFG